MSLNDINEEAFREMNSLRIWQQNVNKSNACQHDLLSSNRLTNNGIDIIALQEPAINQHGGTVSARDWAMVYPTTHLDEPTKTRSILYISNSILTDNWEQINITLGDVTAVKIKGRWGTLTIYNIYNDCEHDRTLDLLADAHKKHLEEPNTRPKEQEHLMWLGDFNRHHPHWDAPSDSRLFTTDALLKAEKLIELVASVGLDLALPPKTLTHLHNITKRWSRLDHVFLSDHSMEALISCEALTRALRVKTDHVPILTKLDLMVRRTSAKSVQNFQEVEWDKFREELRKQLDAAGAPATIRSQQMLDEECEKLTSILKQVIDEHVPSAKIGPRAKRWWTKELLNLRRQANKLGRKSSKRRSDPEDSIHAEYANTKKQYEQEIEYCKRHHWRDWLEKAEDLDIWTAHRYISASAIEGNRSRIPTLITTHDREEMKATTNEEKSRLLAKTFFPEKLVRSNTPSEQDVDDQICELDPINKEQIRRHLAKLKLYKAPGPNGIPNIVLIKSADIISDRLLKIYTAMVDRGLFYKPWKHFTTVVLRKPGKPKYNVLKAYRLIALLNTMVKVLTAILAELMMYYAEKHNLLPENHFRGRKGRAATDAVHLLVHSIKDAWHKGKVMAVLFLDIEGAFPNADNEQLARNLRKRRLPDKLVNFVADMLKDRTTVLKFDDHTSERITLNNGIGQGDPLSMALYQFYNADLLNIPTGKNESAIAYVDDAILTATADTFQQAHERLADMMTREGGAIEWTEIHNSCFEYSKLALIDFAHRSKRILRPALILPNITITPTDSAKYLGIILDKELNWREQEVYVTGKGTTWSAQIRRAVRPSWGLTPKMARKLYVGVALPRILYGIDVWFHAACKTSKDGAHQGKVAAYRKLTTIQRQGTLAITGGFRTLPTDALDAYASLLPMQHRLRRSHHLAATRIASLPHAHPLHKPFRRPSRRRTKRHRSALHHLAECLAIPPDEVETIPVVTSNPARKTKLPFGISIASDKNQSKREDAAAMEEIKVYINGSLHDDEVGAAAILYRGDKRLRTLCLHLGPAEHHTVYEAELVGLLLGIHLIKTEKKS